MFVQDDRCVTCLFRVSVLYTLEESCLREAPRMFFRSASLNTAISGRTRDATATRRTSPFDRSRRRSIEQVSSAVAKILYLYVNYIDVCNFYAISHQNNSTFDTAANL